MRHPGDRAHRALRLRDGRQGRILACRAIDRRSDLDDYPTRRLGVGEPYRDRYFHAGTERPNLLRLQVIIAIGSAFLPLTAAMVTLLIMEERKGDAVNGEKPHEPENRQPLLAADAADPAASPKAQPLADDSDDAAGDVETVSHTPRPSCCSAKMANTGRVAFP